MGNGFLKTIASPTDCIAHSYIRSLQHSNLKQCLEEISDILLNNLICFDQSCCLLSNKL